MFVSIDMDKLQFLHKHHDQTTLNSLAWLEAPNKSVRNENASSENFLITMSSIDLRMLYKNTTGGEVEGLTDITIREMLAIIANDHINATLALSEELCGQIAKVEEDLYNGIAWKYALGSKAPAQGGELFPLQCKPLNQVNVDKAAVTAPQLLAVRSAPKPRTANSSAVAAPKPAQQASRSYNMKPIIWQEADRIWQEAGSPFDKAIVLELRKEIMIKLEARGIKKTSSSSQLGNWMKERLQA